MSLIKKETSATVTKENNNYVELFYDTETDVLAYNDRDGVATPIGGGSGYTETIVNISSAQILAMGTTPIELLPVAGANAYYDIDKIVLEYNYNTTAYANAPQPMPSMGNFYAEIVVDFLTSTNNDVVIINDFGRTPTGSYERYIINQSLTLGDYNSANPTLGDGTLRVKMYYKIITFGA